MATAALISLEEAVTRFLLKYKRPTEDAVIYTEHAANMLRDFHLYDSPNVVTEKVDINSLGIISMPTDMIGFNGLFIPSNGELWSFTEKESLVNTTTTTGGVEGHDTDFGEGVAVSDPKTDTYGGVGGVNDYYYALDWKARRIFCEGISSDTVILRYVTSGVETSGTTYMPDFLTPALDSYLLWKSSYWIPTLVRERELLERDFLRAEMKIRNFINSMTYEQWRDLFLSMTTPSPIR